MGLGLFLAPELYVLRYILLIGKLNDAETNHSKNIESEFEEICG